jgi:hypothetical protein
MLILPLELTASSRSGKKRHKFNSFSLQPHRRKSMELPLIPANSHLTFTKRRENYLNLTQFSKARSREKKQP